MSTSHLVVDNHTELQPRFLQAPWVQGKAVAQRHAPALGLAVAHAYCRGLDLRARAVSVGRRHARQAGITE